MCVCACVCACVRVFVWGVPVFLLVVYRDMFHFLGSLGRTSFTSGDLCAMFQPRKLHGRSQRFLLAYEVAGDGRKFLPLLFLYVLEYAVQSPFGHQIYFLQLRLGQHREPRTVGICHIGFLLGCGKTFFPTSHLRERPL